MVKNGLDSAWWRSALRERAVGEKLQMLRHLVRRGGEETVANVLRKKCKGRRGGLCIGSICGRQCGTIKIFIA